MLSSKQISEIREHLEKAQNPLFFYDNDADGLCSFLLFRRFLGRGKGVAVKSYPDLNVQYARKAQELNADYIFILDKPEVSDEFLQEIDSLHLPIVWIDHHLNEKDFDKFSNIYYYNPNYGTKKSSEPVTYWAYKIVGLKHDIWLAIIGCVADHFMPDFADEFGELYPTYWGKVKEPFDVYYKTEIGRIAIAFNFGLKDSITNVVKFQNFLISCKGPDEVFLEFETNKTFRDKYFDISKKYNLLIERAKKEISGNLLFFNYGGDMSISADLANYLSYFFANKYIVVAYLKGSVCNLSLRGNNVKKILEKVLKDFPDASGGGHDDAVGARMKSSDIAKFREAFEKEVN